MEDDSFGCYHTYFNILKFFGAFPYHAQNYGLKLQAGGAGLFLWIYYFNFITIIFGASFQTTQLVLGVWFREENNVDLIGELLWTLLLAVPFCEVVKTIRHEHSMCTAVEALCHLERNIIGSTFRGLDNIKPGPNPTLSSCHLAIKAKFNWVTSMYIFMGIVSVLGVGIHCNRQPRFPGYLYSLTSENDPLLEKLSMVWQIWLVILIWSHIYATEAFVIMASNSIGHCLETVSYRGGVVMTRWMCDECHIDDLITESWQAFEEKKSSRKSSALNFMRELTSGNKKDTRNKQIDNVHDKITDIATLKAPGGQQHLEQDFNRSQITHVIQNLVDIEYALDAYYRVQNVVNDINHTFGRMLSHHQMGYLLVFTTMGFSAIRYFYMMDAEAVIFCIIITAFYLVRMFIFFTAMGNLDHRSDAFIDSWMEGLRYIPRGKYAYEFYWYKIQSCRLLHFWCGKYFTMERATVFEFLYRTSELIIVLLQIY